MNLKVGRVSPLRAVCALPKLRRARSDASYRFKIPTHGIKVVEATLKLTHSKRQRAVY